MLCDAYHLNNIWTFKLLSVNYRGTFVAICIGYFHFYKFPAFLVPECQQRPFTPPPLNYRFINARRRILQPMLDASNPNANVGKAKKSKPPASRAQGRYWPQPNEDESMSPSHYVEVDLEGRISPPPGIHIHSMRSEAT